MSTSSNPLPPEAAERCLRAYFRQVMPKAWPRVVPPARGGQRRSLRRSRLALAASFLVIVAGAVVAALLMRPVSPQPEPLPSNVFPPTAEKPGTHHRPLPPPAKPAPSMEKR
jgi:hypothetical protein